MKLSVVVGLLLLLVLCTGKALSSGFARPCTPPQNTFDFCNVSLPMETRVALLVANLTLAEKASLLGDGASAITRLGEKSLCTFFFPKH